MNSNPKHLMSERRSSAYKIVSYVVGRLVVLFAMVAIAVYLTILIANFGGQIDTFLKSEIDFAIGMGIPRGLSEQERDAIFEERTRVAYEAAGLNTPFAVRCFGWLGRGLLLDWGYINLNAAGWNRDQGVPIRSVILDALPRSLSIFGTANLLLFLTTVAVALHLANRRHSWLDKLIAALTPLSSAPAWIYGVVLNIIVLKIMGSVLLRNPLNAWPDKFDMSFGLHFLRHFTLPLICIFLSGLTQGIYTWRMYFQLHAGEDYVELGRAKGLPNGLLGRRYILRPMLPSLITSFALLFVGLWQQVIILESIFEVAGIGRLFVQVIDIRVSNRTPYIVAMVVTFAYLLAATVFVLDIVYVIVDPRVRVGNLGSSVSVRASGRRPRRRPFQRRQQRSAGFSRPVAPVSKTSRGLTLQGAEGHKDSLLIRLRRAHLKRTLQRHVIRARDRVSLAWNNLAGYPFAVVGLTIILVLIAISIHTFVTIPYSEMLLLWREGEELWMENPRDAAPTWTNLFRRHKLPPTLVGDTTVKPDSRRNVPKSIEAISEEMTEITMLFPFDYQYDILPQDVGVIINTTYEVKRPQVTLALLTPDGREIQLMSTSMQGSRLLYRVVMDEKLGRKLRTSTVVQTLFSDPTDPDPTAILKGEYALRLSAYIFEEDTAVDARFVVYGKVFGITGTDGRRRDLKVPILWGMAMALAFGITAATVTTFSSILIAAVGAWIGGWVDTLVQRITEVNMILPFLPVSVMVYTLYSKSLWAILGVTVVLTIFDPSIKTYRALFLQIRESPYIEAARAYGASSWRIMFRYLIPRIVPVLIPRLVILVPSYVFLEATLAMLGISDPVLPTWGKLVIEALSRGPIVGNYYLILQPIGLLLLVGFAFAMLGLSLERILKAQGRLA